MSRNFRINRNDEIEATPDTRVGWLDRFADSLVSTSTPKSAVEVARKRVEDSQSMVDVINSMMGKRTVRFSSVEQAVSDLQERTGLSKYLKMVSADADEEKKNVKTAQDTFPTSLSELSEPLKRKIFVFTNNYVDNYFGDISIPAVQNELVSVFENEGLGYDDFSSEDVLRFINDCIIKSKMKNPNMEVSSDDIGKDSGASEWANDAELDHFKWMGSKD